MEFKLSLNLNKLNKVKQDSVEKDNKEIKEVKELKENTKEVKEIKEIKDLNDLKDTRFKKLNLNSIIEKNVVSKTPQHTFLDGNASKEISSSMLLRNDNDDRDVFSNTLKIFRNILKIL